MPSPAPRKEPASHENPRRALLGALTGLIAGLIASEVIGIAGMLLLHRELGIKYLPLILAAVFAALAVPAHRRTRAERRGRGGPR